MSFKSLIQIVILLLIPIIVGSVYFKYFDEKKKVVEEIKLSEGIENKKLLDLEKKILELESKNNNLSKKLQTKINEKITVEETNILESEKKTLNKNEEIKKNKKNELDKKKEEAKRIEKKEIKKIKLEDKDKEIKNFVKDVEYTSVDEGGNRFRLLANSGKTNNTNKNILDLENVRGEIKSDKRDTIFITSDYAEYNISNLDSKFYENVIIDYQDKKISCVNFDINMSTNKAVAYNDVIITDPKSTMKAGIVEFDLKTKDININPESINTKIEVISN
ncbi:MAG: LPS export ABC transporter periplasmic protein LptC [Candidatus Pelagibacter sp.]|nr:LPS export ABC transporter periplasmic protein LptC [Candidatus Pelagibacter sp.]